MLNQSNLFIIVQELYISFHKVLNIALLFKYTFFISHHLFYFHTQLYFAQVLSL